MGYRSGHRFQRRQPPHNPGGGKSDVSYVSISVSIVGGWKRLADLTTGLNECCQIDCPEANKP